VKPQRIVASLLAILAVGAAAFFTVTAFAMLLGSLGDERVARVLHWVGGGIAIVLLVDLILLVVAVGIRSLTDGPEE